MCCDTVLWKWTQSEGDCVLVATQRYISALWVGWNFKCGFSSLSWKSFVTRTSVNGFGWNLVEDMCTMCAIYPVNMSSIGGGSRFGGNSKVYKCSLSWNRLITRTSGVGWRSNLGECMASVFWCCPVKMSSIGGGSRFGGNSKVYKCSLSWNQLITSVRSDGFRSNLDEDMCTMCATCPVKMS